MIATRAQKASFSIGEKVLCYEPDPNKAKVLYDSKVLEVITKKDDKNKKYAEYLIHFQGWNPSWDRCVSEDFVLKDTEENRKLQKELADKAELQKGSYLYRKGHKKKSGDKMADSGGESYSPNPRARATSITSCSTMKSEDDMIAEDEDEELHDAGSEAGSVAECTQENNNVPLNEVPIELSSTIKKLLDDDYSFICEQKRLIKLPQYPNAIQIFEEYVKYQSRNVLTKTGKEAPSRRSKKSNPPRFTEDSDSILYFLNLCKETVDSLKTMFDVYLGGILLYAEEKEQYMEIRNGKEYSFDVTEQVEMEESDEEPHSPPPVEENETDRKKSLRSHKTTTDAPLQASTSGVSQVPISAAKAKDNNTGHNNANHHTARSCSSVSSYYSSREVKHFAVDSHFTSSAPSNVQKYLKSCETWRLVPDWYKDKRPHYPCMLYGATHLARLFVRLPVILYRANKQDPESAGICSTVVSPKKMEVIVQHCRYFMEFVESHTEWFGEKYYEPCPTAAEVLPTFSDIDIQQEIV